jgi:hypothetical protein
MRWPVRRPCDRLLPPLLDLLRFRHLFGHARTVNWDLRRLDELGTLALTVWPEVRHDLDAFRRHLLGQSA